MKKLLLRIAAYALDSILIMLISFLLVQVPLFNPTLKQYNDTYQQFIDQELVYDEFAGDIDKYLEDGHFTSSEIAELKNKYIGYDEVLDKITLEEEVSLENKDKLKKEIEEKHRDVYNDQAYKIQKYNIPSNIISIILLFLYFGVFQFLMHGQTIFKKLFKLRVVSTTKKDIPWWSYLIRVLLVNEVIFLGIDLLSLIFLKESMYLNINYWLSEARYIFEIVMLVVMMMREDGRGLHDLLLNTRVALYDKDGIEVITPVSEESKDKVKELKETPKSNVKKAKSKTRTTKKKNEKDLN